MTQEPLVSVIVPTYKRKPKLIERSIESILNQTYDNFELLVVDDSPSDYSERVYVKKYLESISDNRIKYIQHPENKGANFARNTGARNAKGEYLAFLDDDDEWLSTKLEKQLEMFKDNVALVYCKAIIINETNDTVKPILNEMWAGKHYTRLLKQNFIGSNSFVMISKKAFDYVGMYDENLLSNQDYDLFLRIAKEFNISYVDEVLVKYYIHDGERISTNAKKQLQGRLELHKKFREDVEKNQELSLAWEIKTIPLYYRSNKKGVAIQKTTKILLSHPVYFIEYLKGTLRYIKKSKSSKGV